MTTPPRTHLDQLESQSIFIFREAYRGFKNIAMPWSMGDRSGVAFRAAGITALSATATAKHAA